MAEVKGEKEPRMVWRFADIPSVKCLVDLSRRDAEIKMTCTSARGHLQGCAPVLFCSVYSTHNGWMSFLSTYCGITSTWSTGIWNTKQGWMRNDGATSETRVYTIMNGVSTRLYGMGCYSFYIYGSRTVMCMYIYTYKHPELGLYNWATYREIRMSRLWHTYARAVSRTICFWNILLRWRITSTFELNYLQTL